MRPTHQQAPISDFLPVEQIKFTMQQTDKPNDLDFRYICEQFNCHWINFNDLHGTVKDVQEHFKQSHNRELTDKEISKVRIAQIRATEKDKVPYNG